VTALSPAHQTDHRRRLRPIDWAFLGFLLIVWPGITWLNFPSGNDALNVLTDVSRSLTYLQSMAITGSVFLFLAVVLRFQRWLFVDLGLKGFTLGNTGFGFLLLVVANVVLQLISITIPAFRPGPDDFVMLLLPRTTGERLLWLGLSATAAVGEETIFRGYVLTRLHHVFGHWTPAVILSALGFGLAHIYQGWAGVVLTAVYGVIFSLVYIRRQSLWPCIIAHFLQDAIAILPIDFPSL